MLKRILFFAFIFVSFPILILAQRTTEIGLSTGAIRYYPDVQRIGTNPNNRVENGLGFSAGVFFEDHWKSRIHQIVEVNYYKLSSDVYLQKTTGGTWGYGDEPPLARNYPNNSFDQLAVSGGLKLFLNKNLFIYPGFELMRALNKKVDVHKTTYNAKLGAGLNLKMMDIILEYSYGLNNQRTVYDSTVPFATAHTNNFLQLKLQIPFYRFR